MKGAVPYLNWRDGRPRWIPSPELRARGFKGQDFKDEEGRWLDRDAAERRAHHLNARLRLDEPRQALCEAALSKHEHFLLRLATNNSARGSQMPPRLAGPAYVYVFSLDARWAKIGFSSRPRQRWKTLSTGAPLDLFVHMIAPGTVEDERTLHAIFKDQRVRGEWFRVEGPLAHWLTKISRARNQVSEKEQTFRSI